MQGISDILADSKTDICELASQILDSRFENLSWREMIPASEIEFVQMPYADYVVEKEVEKVEVILPTVRPEVSPEDGKYLFSVTRLCLYFIRGSS